jgi:hypothetical protein
MHYECQDPTKTRGSGALIRLPMLAALAAVLGLPVGYRFD